MKLNNKKKNVRNLVKIVEKMIIELLKLYNIESYADRENIGIWVNGKKSAAIGIRVSQWIAYHGCSINMNNNLNHYKKIIPCGLSNSNITSMVKETRNKLTNIETNLKKIFIKNLKDI